MAKRLSLATLFLAALAIAGAYASAFLPGGAPGWAAWALALATPAALVAMMVLGAAGRGGFGRLAWLFVLTFVILAGGFGALLVLPSAEPSDPVLWLGFPPRAALLLYGIGLLPLLIIPVAYALTFDRATLPEADLERVLAAAKASR